MKMDGELEMDLQDVDDSYTPGVHNKLLGAVSQLYEKKRVKAPTRKEASLEVSEFHLSHPDKKRGQIKVTDLAKVLNKRTTHADISQKLKNAQNRAKTLPKPLEKIYQDKINRKAGYEQAKQHLNRWDAIVYKQKVADQVSFPLKSDTIKVHESSDVSTLFRKPTELEMELAKVLNQPNPFEAKKEEKGENKNQGKEDYPLTLAEVIEKRKMMAKLRAQQSYQQAKAARHSKIKSKKFHQIQRRARVKEQLREFEELQRKDPQAALKKLEELERTRAEERVTLRHRSTGQWAKNLVVRAKYDKEARIALAEQLSKSRELTVKLGKNQEDHSDKEEDGEEEENQSKPEDDPNNPWVVKRSKDMEDFVSGYRKYWESKGKEQEKLHNQDTAVKVDSNQDETGKVIDKDTNKDNTNPRSEFETSNQTNDNGHSAENEKLEEKQTSLIILDKTNYKRDKSINAELHTKQSTLKKLKTFESENNATNADADESQRTSKSFDGSIIRNRFTADKVLINDSPNQDEIKKKKLLSNFNVENVSKKRENKNKINYPNKHQQLCNSSINSKMNCSVGSWTVSRNKDKTGTKISSIKGKHNISVLSNSFEITESNTSDKVIDKVLSNGIREQSNERPPSRKNKSLDELFEEVEDKLQDRVRGKIENIKAKINCKRKIEDGSDTESEQEDIPSLELKKQITPMDVDEELIQQLDDKSEERIESDLSKTLKTAAGEVKPAENIDPNKFLKVTRRHLLSKVPEIMSEGDEALDDEEKVAEDRHLTISEAFAEDDVVDQFQKEKEEEVKKNSVGNVDLTLPGWGSWAGHNMRSVSRRKRKKFVIKFPKAIPRRDTNRGNVIINEDADKPIKEHQVSDVPFPFTSVEEYEASIRAPIGTTWMPQTAHAKLTLPPVVTKMGAVIGPMDESQLVSKDESLSSNNMKKKKPKIINRKKAKSK